MTRKVIILISVILLAVMAASAKREKENPRAEIKVSCRYPHKRLKTDAKAFDSEYNMTLLAKSGYSKFFSQITGYHDSLDSIPSGKALFNKMMGEGVKKFIETDDDSFVPRNKGSIYLFKNTDYH